MSRLSSKLAYLIVWAALSAALVILWGHYPQAVPTPPAWLVNYLVEFYQPKNAEEVADLELIYSFLVCGTLSAIALVALQKKRRR